MKKYEGDGAYYPISAWGYLGYSLLFMIPVVGLIFMIAFSVSGRNLNRRSFARSYLLKVLIVVVLVLVASPGVREAIGDLAANLSSTVQQQVEQPTHRPTAEPDVSPRPTLRQTRSKTPTQQPTATPEPQSGVTPEFKKMMDGFEKFFNDYVEFIKDYESGNMSDLGMVTKYTQMMAEYADTMAKLDEIDEDELSPADAAYYIEVVARIEKKLLELAH